MPFLAPTNHPSVIVDISIIFDRKEVIKKEKKKLPYKLGLNSFIFGLYLALKSLVFSIFCMLRGLEKKRKMSALYIN